MVKLNHMSSIGPLKSEARLTIPGWSDDRPVDVYAPSTIGDKEKAPLLLVLHGYTQDSRSIRALTSPDGTSSHPDSLDRLAEREGFIVAYPNGTREPAYRDKEARSWNAGDGDAFTRPMLGEAHAQDVDDVQYLSDTIAHLREEYDVDSARIYVCGFSNGAAMAHRVGVELSGTVAAIGAVAGTNHHLSDQETREPYQSIPVMQIHGDGDPVWPYWSVKAPRMAEKGPWSMSGGLEGVPSTIGRWVAKNGLDAEPRVTQTLFTRREDYSREDGQGDVCSVRVHFGGHAWPGGATRPLNRGLTIPQVNTNELLWQFFEDHPKQI